MSVAEGDAPVAEGPRCPHCLNSPCLLDQGLYRSIVDHYEGALVDEEGEALFTSKEIRFRLYRHATAWIHGFLGRGTRIQLPVCVRGEILDLSPEPDHVYVGFIPSS